MENNCFIFFIMIYIYLNASQYDIIIIYPILSQIVLYFQHSTANLLLHTRSLDTF